MAFEKYEHPHRFGVKKMNPSSLKNSWSFWCVFVIFFLLWVQEKSRSVAEGRAALEKVQVQPLVTGGTYVEHRWLCCLLRVEHFPLGIARPLGWHAPPRWAAHPFGDNMPPLGWHGPIGQLAPPLGVMRSPRVARTPCGVMRPPWAAYAPSKGCVAPLGLKIFFFFFG